MTKQSDVFLLSEGDAWYERNHAVLKEMDKDPVVCALNGSGIKPNRLLEIGCSDGWRLLETISGC